MYVSNKTEEEAKTQDTNTALCFRYIVKPEVVSIGGRRYFHHGITAGRDANAVVCRMDRADRLWVAISVTRSDAWQGRPRAQPPSPPRDTFA